MHRMLPSSPGAIIGYRRNGMPIRLIAGASEPAPEPPAAPAPAPPPQVPAAPPAQGEPAPAAPATAGPPAGDGGAAPGGSATPADSIESLPAWAQKVIRDTRQEAAASRTKAKEQADALAAAEAARTQQLDGIARALGLKPEEATPEQIAAERDAAKANADAAAATARAAAVELAVFRAAAAAEVNGNALLDSRSFVGTLEGLNPADPGFSQQVQDKIAAAVQANPGWKLAPVPPAAIPGQPATPAAPPLAPSQPAVPASGPQGSFTAAPAGPRQLTEADVRNMSPAEVVKAMNEGLFVGEGFGPRRRDGR